MPPRPSLHWTRPSASMSRFDPGSRNRTVIDDAIVEGTGRPDRDTAMAEVQRQCRGEGVAEAILNRYPEDDPRARASAEAVGKQVRRERREDVLHGAVLVDVAGNAESREIAHFVGVGDGAAENQDRQPPSSRALIDRTRSTPGAGGRRKSSTMRSMVATSSRTRASSSAPLFTATARVARAFERGAEPVADKRGVVSDDDGLRRRLRARPSESYRIASTEPLARVAVVRAMSL